MTRLSFCCLRFLYSSVFLVTLGISDARADEVEIIGGIPLTKEQQEAARRLVASGSKAVPAADGVLPAVRPKPRPTLSTASALPPKEPYLSEIAVSEATMLAPPARLVGIQGDIPLRSRPSRQAQIEKIIRGQAITSELITGDWYLVVVNASFFFVHRDEVLPAPR